ncbi:MAG: hypothetical protein PHQ43_09730 [Dehalococcoidales bacterium]|nr:hypothetical protein [Dehalococcoidales bacterium]
MAEGYVAVWPLTGHPVTPVLKPEAIDTPMARLYDSAMKILPFLLETGANLLTKIPIEKMLVKPQDTSQDRKKLMEILHINTPEKKAPAPSEVIEPENPPDESQSGVLEPRRMSQPKTATGVSDAETVAYQEREIAKLLLRMERHYAQRMRIGGRACDCGAGKHLLDIEAMVEETIPMVEEPDVYYRLLEWVKKVGPASTTEAAQSGRFDSVYPIFSREARDFRKEIMGTLDPKALWPGKTVALEELFKRHDQADSPITVEPVPAALPEPEEPPANEIEPQASLETPAE